MIHLILGLYVGVLHVHIRIFGNFKPLIPPSALLHKAIV